MTTQAQSGDGMTVIALTETKQSPLTFLLVRLQSRNHRIRVIQHGIHCKHTVLTDRRKNLTGHPALELFRIRQLAGKDERIKTGFVNQDCVLLSADGVVNPDGILIFLIHMSCKRIFRLFVPPESPLRLSQQKTAHR